MDKILIEITGTQQIDGNRDKVELTTVGTIEETENAYIIKYAEEQTPPLQPTDVCIKVRKDETSVEMTRAGTADACLVIEKSRRNLCRYGTEYGDILMGISGHTVDSEYDGEKGKFIFSYDIDFNGALASRNQLEITLNRQ